MEPRDPQNCRVLSYAHRNNLLGAPAVLMRGAVSQYLTSPTFIVNQGTVVIENVLEKDARVGQVSERDRPVE